MLADQTGVRKPERIVPAFTAEQIAEIGIIIGPDQWAVHGGHAMAALRECLSERARRLCVCVCVGARACACGDNYVFESEMSHQNVLQ